MEDERLTVRDTLKVTDRDDDITVNVDLTLGKMKLIDAINYEIMRLEGVLAMLTQQRDKVV